MPVVNSSLIIMSLWVHFPHRLGGNPICKAISNGCPNNEFIVYDNPSQNEIYPQLNCRNNSSQPLIIQGEF
jgi:hypothetical protein